MKKDDIKTGLILEGGAMRGMFTSGILDVFMENGIEFDGAIGVLQEQPSDAIINHVRLAEPSVTINALPMTGDTVRCVPSF